MKRAFAALLSAGILSGCAVQPSLTTQKEQTLATVLASKCHGDCTQPVFMVKPSHVNFQERAFDLAVALRAAAGQRKLIDTAVNSGGGVMDLKPEPGSGSESGAQLNLDAGIIASGAGASIAGGVLGGIGLLGALMDAPKVPHYHPWYRIPYLSFYRGYRESWMDTQSLSQLKPALQQGYDLLVATRNGHVVSPGSVDFVGTLYSGNRSQHHHVTHLTISGSSTVSSGSVWITWNSGTGQNPRMLLAAFPINNPVSENDPQAFGILVRTGQPSGFYTPEAVEHILKSVSGSRNWYAIFNDPIKGGGWAQFVIHDGKMYRVSAY